MQDFHMFHSCAVVVPETVQKCRDVLPASPQLTHATPYPFGLRICTWDVLAIPYNAICLPLIYVSEQVARDRSPERHELNGSGVRAGWYVIAQPEVFEVHAPYCKPEYEELPWENGWGLTLEVDGQDTHSKIVIRRGVQPLISAKWEGFLEERIPCDILPKQAVDKIRLFEFEKITKGLERRCDDSDVGMISLKVCAGIHIDQKMSARSFSHRKGRKEVSAKGIAREGRTMQVSNNGALLTKRSPRFVEMHDLRRVPKADITIFVREQNWLRSRRLVDDDGKPVTYDTYLNMLKQDSKKDNSIVVAQEKKKKMKVKDEFDLECEEIPVKKAKIEEEVVLKDKTHLADVVDLTDSEDKLLF